MANIDHLVSGVISISILLLMLLHPLTSHVSAGANPEITRTSALDGHYPIADSAFATFLGSGSESPQGKLGEFVGHADVNGDGIEDIVMSAPRLYSPEGEQHAGVCYIWYGNSSLPGGNIDLEEADPDITIKATSPGSYLLSSITAGDLNDDGFTDMALGMPKQGDSGKVYLLWGNATGWEKEIILYKAGNAEPNGDPIGFLRREDFGIISGLVTTTVQGTKLGHNVILEDMDGDGSDDLLFSFHGWNKVFAVWGGYPKLSFGTEFTYLQLDPNSTAVPGDFGQTMAVGDLNDDGKKDLIIGAPLLSDEDRGFTQTGALFVYFNTSAFRGNRKIGSLVGCRPLIFGQDAYDHLGRGLVIEDINQDGSDDIIAGAPDADGLLNKKPGAGEIFVFWGGDISKFPTVMRAEEVHDIMIIGAMASTVDHPGDSIGSAFDVGDIDGDARKELVIGAHGREVDGLQSVGMVMGFDDGTVFPRQKVIIDLEKAPMKFSLWGAEIEDVTGYSVSLFDANGDGADDLLVGSPSADGIDNLRPGCGEASFVTGTVMSVRDLTITGSAVVNGKVLPGYGPFSIDVPFSHTNGAENIERIEVVLEKGTVDAHLLWEGGVFSYHGPSVVSIDNSACSISDQGISGGVSFSVSMDWYSDLARPWDIDISLDDGSHSVERTFHDALAVNNRVFLGGSCDTFIDGKATYIGDWQRPGSSLQASGMGIFYADSDGVLVPPADMGLSLSRNGELVDSVVYEDEGTVLEDLLAGAERSEYLIEPFFNVAPPADVIGATPSISGGISFNVVIDNDAPDAPEGLRLIQDANRDSVFDDDGHWAVEWNSSLGPEGDHGSSGVREYRMSNDRSVMVPVMTRGGLTGTYYDMPDFSVHSYQKMDREIYFDWGHWGPDVQKLTPAAFSVRWHGWLMVDDTRHYRFSLSGDGKARMLLGDEVVIDWDDIDDTLSTGMIPLDEGVAVPLVIYYSNDDLGKQEVSSSITLRYLDDRGGMSLIPSYMLHYPGNTTEVSSGGKDLINISLVAVDWVEHVSSPASVRWYTDHDPPEIDLSALEAWYNTTTPRLEVLLRDPPTMYGSGSGLDTGSIWYKVTDAFGWGEWVSVKEGIEVLEDGLEGPSEVEVNILLSLTENWKGSISWSASDLCGNSIVVGPNQLGTDMKEPSLNIISDTASTSPAGEVRKLLCKATEMEGSGVDGASLQWRTGKEGNWSDWTNAGCTGVHEELDYEISPLILPGDNLVQLRGADAVGNMAESRIYLFRGVVPEVDRAPMAVIDLPLNGTSVRLGTLLKLDASSSSDDGSGEFAELRFTWSSDRDGYLGSGKVLGGVLLKTLGNHRITVFVDDGTPGHNVSASITLKVIEDAALPPDGGEDGEGGPIDIVSILLIIVSFIVVSLVLWVIIKSVLPRNAGEARMDVVERTDDDLEYDEMAGDDEKFLEAEGPDGVS
ncbi:MAG: FG-GAP repeat protein [Candidatus Thermoplasmatota archaeon]|nr:FG-GAP repeat protein [Candidatus Thermoplasmatota archaeon]